MTRHLATLRESRSVSTLMPLKIIATQRNRTCTSVSLQASGPIRTCRARHQLDDEAFGYLKRVEVRFDPNAFSVFLVTTSSNRDWVICAPAAFLGSVNFSDTSTLSPTGRRKPVRDR